MASLSVDVDTLECLRAHAFEQSIGKRLIVARILRSPFFALGGAHRALGNSNDSLVLNPAGMAVSQHYSVDASYAHGLDGAPNHINFSITDPKSTAVAGGIGYTLSKMGDSTSHRVYLGTAYAVTPWMSLGTTAKYIHGEYKNLLGEKKSTDYFATDFGLRFQAGQYLSFGFTLHNIVRSENNPLSTHQMGLAIAYTGYYLTVAFDAVTHGWSFGLQDVSYHVGTELSLYQRLKLRGGYTARWDPFEGDENERSLIHRVSGGVAYAGQRGAMDVAYVRSINGELEQSVMGTIRLYF